MIQSFQCPQTQAFFEGRRVARFESFRKVAERKLTQLDAARTLDFLCSPPGNRLEALRGDRVGLWSIRINDRWRVCFEWREGHAWDVEIVDYH